VREASGLKQKEFADLIGLGRHLYEKLEEGRARLTPENALLIFEQTGAIPTSLDHRTSSVPLSIKGRTYSGASWRSRRKYLARFERIAWPIATYLVKWTHFLLDAAEKNGKLKQTHRALARALREVAADCGLEAVVLRELARTKLRVKLDFTYGDLRKGKLLAKAVGFVNQEYRNGKIICDDEKWEGTVTSPVRWDPSGYFPEELAQGLEPLWPPAHPQTTGT